MLGLNRSYSCNSREIVDRVGDDSTRIQLCRLMLQKLYKDSAIELNVVIKLIMTSCQSSFSANGQNDEKS